jgi:hypothetical protein
MARGQQKQDHMPVKSRIKYFNERNGRMQPLDNSRRKGGADGISSLPVGIHVLGYEA